MTDTDYMTIWYATLPDGLGRYVTGSWGGSLATALEAAAEALGAERMDDGRWCYHADELSAEVAVSEADLARLGAALLSGYSLSDTYSIWCAESEWEELDD